MKTVLLITSFVASSQVGANASTLCFRKLGVDVVTLPTILLGRHPGWGDPGGEAVSASLLEKMWKAVDAQNIPFDAIMTGYMGSEEQIDHVADIIASLRTQRPELMVLVDPVMGDHGKLYIPKIRAEAIKTRLVPLADLITPNVWELSFLTDRDISKIPDVISASERLIPDVLTTSVPTDDKIGALWSSDAGDFITAHPRYKKVPHGGGDMLAALFLGHRLNGLSINDALGTAVASVFAILAKAATEASAEIPLTQYQDHINDIDPMSVTRL